MANESNKSNESSESGESLIKPTETSLTYASYLKVSDLLALQEPLTQPAQHDEMLFIIIHQVYELWFKQILHEVKRAIHVVEHDQLLIFNAIAKRIAAIQRILTSQVDILETMTPVDFNAFRDRLNPASGFQSYQFRELEFRLGVKESGYLKFHAHDQVATAILTEALQAPSLYDRFLQLLSRRGFELPASVLQRDNAAPYQACDEVRAAMVKIYQEADRYYDLYSTLEALIDLDEGLLLWRQRHVAMVERMIGNRRGTGGSSGVKYLTQTLAKRFFPEIWDARNWLGDLRHEQHKDARSAPKSGR